MDTTPAPPQPAAPGATVAQGARTGLEVTTRFFPLAFLLYFFKPTIVIDGTPTRVKWGTVFFDLQPGRHHVEIFFRYIFMDAGKASVDLDLAAGQTLRITYRAPWLLFLPGRIKEA
jgi:hypothetical protein